MVMDFFFFFPFTHHLLGHVTSSSQNSTLCLNVEGDRNFNQRKKIHNNYSGQQLKGKHISGETENWWDKTFDENRTCESQLYFLQFQKINKYRSSFVKGCHGNVSC